MKKRDNWEEEMLVDTEPKIERVLRERADGTEPSIGEAMAEILYLKSVLKVVRENSAQLAAQVRTLKDKLEKVSENAYKIMTSEEFEPFIYNGIAKAVRDRLK